MKFNIFKVLSVLFVFGLVSCTKDIDNILKEHYKARGGDYIQKVTSVYAEGKSMSMMMAMPFRMNFILPSKLRYDFVIMGKEGSSIFNDNKIWMVQDSNVTEVPAEFVADNKRDVSYQAKIFKSDLVDFFLNKQGKIEYLGKDTSNKSEFYKIRLIKDSIIGEFWLDTKTFLEHKITFTRTVGKNKVIESVKLDDFKKVGNLMIPHKVSVSVSNADEMPKPAPSLTFQKFEINRKIDESIFQPPVGKNQQPENHVKK